MDTGSRSPSASSLSEVWVVSVERFIDINLETNQAYLYLDDKPLIEVGYPDWFYGLREILLSF